MEDDQKERQPKRKKTKKEQDQKEQDRILFQLESFELDLSS